MSEFFFLCLFFVFFLFSVIEFYFYKEGGNKIKSVKLASCFFGFYFFFLIAGFRSVGFSSDDLVYLKIYQSFMSGGEVETSATSEYFFVLLNKFSVLISSNVSMLFVLFAFFTALFTCISFFYGSKLVSLSLLVYLSHVFLYRDLIQIRAGLSYSLIMLLVGFLLVNGRSKLYMFSFVFPGLIHSSGFLSLVFPALYRLNYTRKIGVGLVGLSFFLGLLGFGELVVFILGLVNFGGLQSAVNTYILIQNEFNYDVGFLNPTLLKNVFWFFVFNCFYNNLKEDKAAGLLFWMYTVSTCILLALNDFSVLSARLASLFSIAEFYLIPMVIVSSYKNSSFLFSLALFYSMAMVSLNLFFKNMFSGYSFFFVG